MKHSASVHGSLAVLGCFLAAITSQAASTYTISATANIYSAGLSVPVGPGGSGAGILPTLITLSPGQNVFQFSATGSVTENYGNGVYHGPDGGLNGGLTVLAYGGLSGFITGQNVPLAGVFLSGAAPFDPAPPTLDFTAGGLGLNFTTLAPQLGQVFFIGDGQTDGAITQTFYVPAGATRLFLGFPDAPFGSGLPGAFDDNAGSLDVTVMAVPEPASVFGLGALALVTVLHRRKQNRVNAK